MQIDRSKAIFSVIFLIFFFCDVSSNTINVKKNGAIGDGFSNDTEFFKVSIKKLKDNDTLYIPEGTYVLDQFNFENLKHITIRGNGKLLASENSNSYFSVIINCPGILISGIKIDCMNRCNLGVDVFDSPEGSISGVEIINIYGADPNWSSGIRLRKNNSDFIIENARISSVNSVQKAAIGIWILTMNEEVHSENITIINNQIYEIDSPNDADGIKIQQIGQNSYITIQNNLFVNTRKRAVKIQSDNVYIKNNKIRRTEEYGNGFAVFSVYGNNVAIDNNEFISYGNSSVNMFVDISAVKNVMVTSNIHINSLTSSTKIKDFILTKYHPNEESHNTSNIVISDNKSSNIRNFIRSRSNLIKFEVKNNIIENLNSNPVFVVDDENINQINILYQENNINYTKYKYKDIYSPKRLEKSLRVIQ